MKDRRELSKHRRRKAAVRGLAIAASTPGVFLFEAVDACVSTAELRAEAEAMLRTGWTP